MNDTVSDFAGLLVKLKIIPVLIIESVADALAVCRALQAGGIQSVEITLRSAAAMDAIKAVKEQFPALTVAAGTIKSSKDIEALKKLDIAFGVSPGLTDEVLASARANDLQLLPGIATPSELMQGLAAGLTEFKLFPAEAVGGIPLLKSLASPFPEARFCPTGGISPENANQYLSLANVLCVGGSWMVAPTLIKEQQWQRIEQLSRVAISSC